jgi:hypothetical protein
MRTRVFLPFLPLLLAAFLLAGCGDSPGTPTGTPPTQTDADPADPGDDPGDVPLPGDDDSEPPPGGDADELVDDVLDPDIGVILEYRFTAGAKDFGPNGFDGRTFGDPAAVSTCLDQGLAFDGVDDFVWVAPHPKLEPAVVTVEAYFRPDVLLTDGSTFVPIVVRLPGAADFGIRVDGYDLWYQDSGAGGRIGMGLGTREGLWRESVNAFVDISPDTFHHVVGTYDGSEMRLYLDGELVDSRPHTEPIAYLGGPTLIGGHVRHSLLDPSYARHYFPGEIDEVVIYERVLDPDEVRDRARRCRDLRVEGDTGGS